MPLHPNAIDLIRQQLQLISCGERPKIITIGALTEAQLVAINNGRTTLNLPHLGSPEIVYLGKHQHQSRSADGYHIEDMILQLQHGMHEKSIVKITRKGTCLESVAYRNDGYGNSVVDRVVLELTSRLPKAEAFSTIPIGDAMKPKDAQKPKK